MGSRQTVQGTFLDQNVEVGILYFNTRAVIRLAYSLNLSVIRQKYGVDRNSLLKTKIKSVSIKLGVHRHVENLKKSMI